jgi:16S rRNA (guanine(966)-N(2))-methyltransferase RsmD
MHVRPTPDRLREALFNVLQPRIEGTVFLDAYAGTGAVGIEALSRGASHIVLIEKRPDALAIIRENLASLQVTDEVTVVRGAAGILLRNYRCDIAFIDPPYEQVAEYFAAMESLVETGCTLAIAQHDSKLVLDEAYGPLQKTRVLKQGDNSLSFYQRA